MGFVLDTYSWKLCIENLINKKLIFHKIFKIRIIGEAFNYIFFQVGGEPVKAFLLKNKFNTNEILTSLMLVYVALFILDFLVVGPWRDPEGYSFPKTRSFSDSGRMPLLFEGLRIHIGLIITLILIFISWFVFAKTIFGFQLKVSGFSPIAARYAGFNQNRRQGQRYRGQRFTDR